jgi:dimethylhistidine N-methyltransferase
MQSIKTLEVSATLPHSFVPEIELGLLAQSASISPKFLYDPLGSNLFAAITLLPEYYPTKTEKNILFEYIDQIVDAVGVGGTLIDLGAGNCLKAESLFAALKPSDYIAIDFSAEFLHDAINNLETKYPHIRMQCIGMDFSKQLIISNAVNIAQRTFFYPGSSIGNFIATEALKLLSQIKSQALGGGLLIGVDLMKEDSILMAAYDDPLKLTAAFNLNILRSVNAHLGSDFKVDQFRHVVKINHALTRVELYLEALEDLTVSWPGHSRTFKRGELIHTEYSHKYTVESIQELLASAGFASVQMWTDPKDYFAVIYAR